jgi:hypothetical protein
MFCSPLIVLFLLAIALFVPRFTDSDYILCIFKLFLQKNKLCRGNNDTHKTQFPIKFNGVKVNDNYSCEKIRNLHMLVTNILSSMELTNPMFFLWGHITDVIIKLSLQVLFHVDTHYYNSTYNTTYSNGRCGRFWNAFSLTNAIGLSSKCLKYTYTLESSNIVL